MTDRNLPRRTVIHALIAGAAGMMAAPLAARAAQSIKITLPTTTPADAAYFVAAQRGYFAAEGLDVELIFAGGGAAVPALISGTVEGSASGAAALSAILRGAALRVVLVFTESPAYQVWAQPDIHTLADLKGKNVGVNTRGDTFEIAMRLALQQAGIPPDSVGYTPVGFGQPGQRGVRFRRARGGGHHARLRRRHARSGPVQERAHDRRLLRQGPHAVERVRDVGESALRRSRVGQEDPARDRQGRALHENLPASGDPDDGEVPETDQRQRRRNRLRRVHPRAHARSGRSATT